MKTLKTLVLKTVTVTGVKLATPADRIGLGLGVAPAYPTDNLSPGQFPMPHNPEPEQVRSRESCPRCNRECDCRRATTPCPRPVRPDVLSPGASAVRFASIRASRFDGLAKDDADGGDRQNPRGSAVPPTPVGPTFPVISVTTTDSAATANRPTG